MGAAGAEGGQPKVKAGAGRCGAAGLPVSGEPVWAAGEVQERGDGGVRRLCGSRTRCGARTAGTLPDRRLPARLLLQGMEILASVFTGARGEAWGNGFTWDPAYTTPHPNGCFGPRQENAPVPPAGTCFLEKRRGEGTRGGSAVKSACPKG